jgi:SAM-dependent methyltransferase
VNKAQDSWSKHEQVQHLYWEILASSELNEVAAMHWVDENDAPISLQMFIDVAAYSLQKSKLDVNGIRILEIGCGNGLLLRALDEVLSKANGEYSLFGTDISESLLAQIPSSNSFNLEIAPANRQPHKSNSFDLVILHSVVQYFEDYSYLNSVIDEIHRVLTPGGAMLLLDVPNAHLTSLMRPPAKRTAKTTVYSVTPEVVRKSYRKLRNIISKPSTSIKEKVAGVENEMPRFNGLHCEPEYFVENLIDLFDDVDVSLQTYKSKPIGYRRFRFNVVARRARKPGSPL